ncbi:MAG: hypothetical protein ACFB2X_01400 [Rivularia sp. (in: cyanobacteria)]
MSSRSWSFRPRFGKLKSSLAMTADAFFAASSGTPFSVKALTEAE